MRAALTRFLAEYRYGDVEVSRRNLNAGFLQYHSKRLRIYVIRHYLQKREYRTRGLCTVNIETTAYCNRKCSFCFYADRFPKREQGIMKEEVYKKVIDDLAAYGFRGRLSPHSYGEPLLDKRLPSLMEYTRKKLPWCTLDVRTNGDYLTEDLLLTLLNKGVDSFLITNYDDDEKPALEALARKYPFPITLRSYKDFGKVDRAGAIFERGESLDKVCVRPSAALVVNWKGNAVLCCQDFYQDHCFGNVMEKSVREIWNDPELVEYRKQLLGGNREVSKICSHCDDYGAVPW
jgi:radical SAM protein with 4Fe4S-binding SPASM domain